MAFTNFLTGLVNILSFLALCSTTRSSVSFLGSTFIFSSSVFLEAISLINDKRELKFNKFDHITICFLILFILSFAGLVISFAGMDQLMDFTLEGESPVRIILSSAKYSTIYLRRTDITEIFHASGILAIGVPFFLGFYDFLHFKFKREDPGLSLGVYEERGE